MPLRVFDGLDLPDEFVTQSAAILARRGAGKTYTAMRLAEEMSRLGLPFAALDPLGVMWGLRSSADGRKPGLPVVILGGEHGDVPLEPTGGKVAAQFVVDNPGAYVLDLSSFDSLSEQDRFATDFAVTLYRAKANVRSALHLIVDEADSFAPQRPLRGQERMLGAYENLVRRGRARGLGVTLISQRPAVLNKNVLSQIEVLVALQVTGPQDRAALDEWAKGYSSNEQRAEFLASLARLSRGEAWVWSPSWLGVFRQVKVRRRTTFDSSATPEVGAERVAVRLADVDLDVLKAAMADSIERQQRDDPAVLRAQIRDLTAEVVRLRAEPTVEVRTETVEVERVPEAVLDHLRAAHRHVEGLGDLLGPVLTDLGDALSAAVAANGRERPATAALPVPPARPLPSDPSTRTQRSTGSPALTALDAGLDDGYTPRAGARRMLDALATYPAGLTKRQVGTIAKVKVTGGTWSTYRSELVRHGLIVDDGDRMRITDAGMAFVDVPALPTDPARLRAEWGDRLGSSNGGRRMYDLLVARYPDWYAPSVLADEAGVAMTGGSWSTYLSRLRSNGLIEEAPGVVRAHPDLFLDGG